MRQENMNCPSCKNEFDNKIDFAYHCPDCGWMQVVDGAWVVMDKEPAKVTEPERLPEPKPVEPAKSEITDLKSENKTRSYLFGLITVTDYEEYYGKS
jgi:hypothetical protein